MTKITKTTKITMGMTDIAVMAEIALHGQVYICEIYDCFSRKANSCNKLVAAGVLNKKHGGFTYVTTYTLAA